jgi:hypothetical protein
LAITKVKSGVRTLGTGEVVDANIATDTISIGKISGSAAASAGTFLKKDGTWTTAGSTSASDLVSGTLANARLADPVDLSAQTGSMKLPTGTTAQRPTGAAGMVRMNSTTESPEWYDTVSSSWLVFGSGLPYSIDFLVIAGGGGAATMGGGAGGYRASFNSEASGGGGSSESAVSIVPGSLPALTITVGAGGGAWVWPSATGATNGSDSVFSTITSTGGGEGGQNGDGAAGGSGGGGGTSVASGTTNQGYAGGTSAGGYNSGGGGGAGAVGGDYTGPTNGAGTAGSGGNGVASTITAGSVTRAGGGAGGAHAYYGQGAASGGSGGGGGSGGVAGSGSTGSGGGGGNLNGAGNAVGAGGVGGSGVVILRMATAQYSGTTTGSPSVATSGDDTILTYNSSGTYTP